MNIRHFSYGCCGDLSDMYGHVDSPPIDVDGNADRRLRLNLGSGAIHLSISRGVMGERCIEFRVPSIISICVDVSSARDIAYF